MSTSVVTLFCEDVRHERSGQFTLVGLIPDNMEVPAVPGMMPKLGVYVRAQLNAAAETPAAISVRFTNTDGSEIPIAQWDQKTINQARADAVNNNSPIYGLIITAVWAPFQIVQPGRAIVEVDIDGTRYVSGILNVVTSSSQPSS